MLRRLWRDKRGNAALLMAAGVGPVTLAIAGGVDMTRAYMADARLQQAVDAATLAGRKVLEGTNVADGSAAELAVQRFLDANFPTAGSDPIFGADPIEKQLTLREDGSFCVTAETRIPTILIGGFKFGEEGNRRISEYPLAADSCARRSGSNIDVVMVLDVTGSMEDPAGSMSRIQALRQATRDFLAIMDTTRTQLATAGLRVRVGFVPYNQTVNIGRLVVADEPTAGDYVSAGPAPGCTGTSTTDKWDNNCQWSNIGWPPVIDNSNKWVNPDDDTKNMANQNLSSANYNWNGTPRPLVDDAARSQTLPDLTNYIAGAGAPGSAWTDAYKWKGCLEARPSVRTIGSTTALAPPPDAAFDVLDIAPGTVTPAGVAPKWRPYLAMPLSGANQYGPPGRVTPTTAPWNQIPWRVRSVGGNSGGALEYRDPASVLPAATATNSGNAGPNRNCPLESKGLTTASKAELDSYVDGLKSGGSTLHDIGMFWGLAMISPGAPFTNPTTYIDPSRTGVPQAEVKKYIVFMTDGLMDPNGSSYSSWGIEDWEDRIKTTNDSTTQHRRRFEMICEQAKRGGVTVYTIALGSSTPNAEIKRCASTADNYYKANDASALIDTFKQIANNIGFLRTSQ
jgi:Flp pilus assembly protein TadG